MIKLYNSFKLITCMLLLLTAGSVFGQVTLPHHDSFNYTSGADLGAQTNWSTFSSSTDDILVSTGNLGFNELETSSGNKISFAGVGDDNTIQFTTQSSGTVYYSFLMKVNTMTGVTNASGGYFAGFRQSGGSFGGLTWLQRVDDNTFKFGGSTTTSTGGITYSTSNYSTGTTYLVVVGYTFNTGTTSDDQIDVWIDPTPGASEPAATFSAAQTGTDMSDIAQLFFRQDSDTETGDYEIDELRIGTAWADVTPSGCTVPTQASAGTPSVDGDNQITMNWTRGGGDGVLVVATEGSAMNDIPLSGTTYSANAAIGSGTEIGSGNFVVYDGTGTSVAVTNLNPGTTYYFTVYEYNSTGTCFNILGVSASETTSTSYTNDTDITDPTSQVAAGTVSSVANDLGSAVDVFTFKLTDVSGDASATLVNSIVIEKGTNNTVSDWSSVIAGAKLSDGSDVTVTGTTVNADNITFDLVGNEYSLADNSSVELTLSVYLTSTVTDGDILAFEIPTSHSFATDANGSGFLTTLSGAITSNDQVIDVVATDISIDVSTSVALSTDFQLTTTAVDANGNTDITARNITISRNAGTGNLTSASVGLGVLAMTDGVYTWTDLQYDTEETFSIDATDGSITTTSASIEAVDVLSRQLFISEVADPRDVFNARFVELYNAGSTSITLDGYYLGRQSNGGSFGNIALTGTIAAGSTFVIANNSTDFDSNYGKTADQYNTTITSNGDDGYHLYFGGDNTSGILIDSYGVIDQDGSGFAWEFTDSRAYRKADIANPNTTWTASEWVIEFPTFVNTSDFNPGVHFTCSSPSTQATAVTFGATDETSMVINWTQGDGTNALVVVKEGSAVDAEPISGNDYTSATSVFSDAVIDLGSSNIVAFSGTSATQTVTVTGLTAGTTYHVAVYEYNSSDFCYNVISPATGSNATTTNAVLSVVEAIADFGSVDNGNSSASQSFTVGGTGLTDDIIITAPSYFEVSEDDATFSSSVTLTQAGGTVSTTTIYVRFSPSSGSNTAQGGDLTIATAGATDETIALTGTETGNSAPYTEDFSSCVGLNGWNAQSVIGAQVWSCTTFGNSGDAAQMSGFSGGAQDNEDWLISPSLELTAISALSFYSRKEFSGSDIEVKISSDYTGTGDPSLATWTDLGASVATGSTWTETAGVDLSSFAGSERYIAFIYYSNTTAAARWTIDDVTVTNAVLSITPPSFTIVESLTDFGSVDNGNTSASQSFTVAGADLTDDITITAPTNFEISEDDATFSNSITLTQTGGSVSTTTIYVRFAPTSGGNSLKTGNLVISTTGTSDETIVISGTETGNAGPVGNVFFSEYYEGSSGNNKYLEIYNNTGGSIDLSNYTIKQGNNGTGFDGAATPEPYSVTLSGTLAAGEVYIIYNGASDVAEILAEGDLALTFGDNPGDRVASFNGDDALGLFENGVLIDLFGDPSVDPGSSWDVAGTTGATANNTLVRKSSVTTGNTVALGSFGTNTTDSEWEVLGADVVTNIGFHTIDGVSSPSLTVVEAITDFGSVDNGSSSASQSFTVEGADLSADITITASSNFEISSDDVTFSPSITLTQSGGTVATTTVYARFTPSTGINSAKSGTITIATTGTSSEVINVSGTETGNAALASDLFISEYVEGSSNNKAIEIYNNSGATADLTLYRLVRYNNGSTTASDTLELADVASTLAAGDLIVIANPSAAQEILDLADITSEITFYNGDDALRLYKEDQLIDEFGEVGVDPGTAWDVAGGSGVTDGGATAEFTLVRKSSIMTGNPVPLASFGTDPTDSEWVVSAQDDFSNLGFHTIDGVTSPSVTITESITDFGSVDNGSTSASQSFTIEGSDLTGDITVTAPSNFEVSDDDANFGSSVTVTQTGGTVASTSVFVRFAPTTGLNGVVTGSLIVSTSGTANQSIELSGTETGNADAVNENFDTCVDLNGWTQFSVVGDGQFWDCTTFGNNSSDGAQMSGFSGGVIDNEDWLISPALNLTASSTLNFWSRTAFSGLPLEVKVSSDYTGSGDPSSSTWTDLTVSLPAISSDTWTETADIDLSSFEGSSVYIAFVYYSNTTDGAARWTLDDVTVFNATLFTPGPGLTISSASFVNDFGQVTVGSESSVSTYTLTATLLTEDLVVSVPAGFEVALDENFTVFAGNSTTPMNIPAATINDQTVTVYVKFVPSVVGTVTGVISHSSTGFTAQTLDVSGEGIEATTTTGLDELAKHNINVYPNPAEAVLNISIPQAFGEGQIRLINLNGKEVLRGQIGSLNTINTSVLNNGVYVLQISNTDTVLNHRVVIK